MMLVLWFPLAWIAIGAGVSTARAQTPDIVIADFEGDDYGTWTVEGTAFGRGPARGTLPGQMAVEGFHGRGLVNSFSGGDGSTGRLISPPFAIRRKSIRFLIGGGGWTGQTCMNLVVNGKVVRTAAGPNTEPGGSERLEPGGWDVSDLAGNDRSARDRRPRDRRLGSHQRRPDHPHRQQAARDAPRRRPLADARPPLPSPAREDRRGSEGWRSSWTAGPSANSRSSWPTTPAGGPNSTSPPGAARRPSCASIAWPRIRPPCGTSRRPTTSGHLATSTASRSRAQFHFSPRRGWNNDPNGLVYAQGEYHLYFQHNPYGWSWGNMHWGHAVSPDLVHWRELPIAIYPRRFGDWAFSGSAVVDRANTSGWKHGENDLLVAAYTSTGRGECIVYSNDRGRTWTEFAGNPVVKHQGRDPRLLWHEPTKRWVMAVYDESDGKRWIAFYTSSDLKTWTFRSRIEGFFECPDLFELPVDGDPSRRTLGPDGGEQRIHGRDVRRRDIPTGDTEVARPSRPGLLRGADVQRRAARASCPDRLAPDGDAGDAVQPGHVAAAGAGSARTPDGPRLTWQPVDELKGLRSRSICRWSGEIKPGDNPLAGIGGERLEIRAAFEPGPASVLTIKVRGVEIVHDRAKREIRVGGQVAPVPACRAARSG